MSADDLGAEMQNRGEIAAHLDNLATALGARVTGKRIAAYVKRVEHHDAELIEQVCDHILDTSSKWPSPSEFTHQVRGFILREREKQQVRVPEENLKARYKEIMVMTPYIRKLTPQDKRERLRDWSSDMDLELSTATRDRAALMTDWTDEKLEWWHERTLAEAATQHWITEA